MVDAVQPYNTNYDKVDGNNVIQQPGNKKDQDSRYESDNRRDMGGSEMHDDLRIRWFAWRNALSVALPPIWPNKKGAYIKVKPPRGRYAAGQMNQQFGPLLYTVSIWALPAFIAITFHEAAHGFGRVSVQRWIPCHLRCAGSFVCNTGLILNYSIAFLIAVS
jgi:hypothetical protein